MSAEHPDPTELKISQGVSEMQMIRINFLAISAVDHIPGPDEVGADRQAAPMPPAHFSPRARIFTA